MSEAKIKDCYRKVNPELDIINADTTLSQAFKSLKKHQVSRTIFVVNYSGKLIGMINLHALIKIASSRFIKQDSLTSFAVVWARKAEDVMVTPASVHEEDLIDKALYAMEEYKIEDVPVVDKEGKIIGVINCFDVLDRLSS